MEAFGINAGNLFVNLVCFGLAYLVITKLIYGPIKKMMDARQTVIEKGLEDAKTAADARKNAELDSLNVLNEAREKGDEIIRDAQVHVSKIKREYRDIVDQEAQKEISILKTNVVNERDKILADLRGQIIEISIAATKKMVSDTLLLDDAKQHKMIEEQLNGLKSAQEIDLSVLPGGQEKIDVITALPLDVAEKQAFENLLGSKLSAGGILNYIVRPEIIGGLIILCGERLINFSVSERMQNLHATMK